MDTFSNPDLNDFLAEQTGSENQTQSSPHLDFTPQLTERKIMSKVKSWESTWDKYKSTYEKNLKTAYNAYKNQQVTNEGVSIKIPEIFTLIETELPHLLNAIFGQSMIIDATPKFQDPEGHKTYKIKNYINRVLKDNCNGRKKTEAIIKNMLVYGTSVVKCYWDTEPDQDVNVMNGEIINVDSSHPNFDLVDPYSFAWDLRNESHDIKNCEWVRERIFISKDKLKVMRDNGLCGPFDDDAMTSTENKGRKERQQGKGEESAQTDNTWYDEYSGTFYSKDEQGKYISDEYIVWLLAGNKIIKFIKNPQKQKMYSIVRSYENPNEFIGLGEPDVIGALAGHLSLVHYQLGKLAKKVGQHLTIVTPAANISPENLRRIEEGVIFVDNKEGISFEPTTDGADLQALLKTKEYLDAQIESVTGIGRALSGESIGDVTATEASLVFQNASNRLALKLTHLQEDFIKEIAEKSFLLSKQLLTIPVQFFDNNNNLVELSPEDFIGNYNWTSNGSIMQANKALQLQQNTNLIQQIIQLAGATQNTPSPLTFNGLEMLQQLIGPYANIPDMSRFVYPQPPPPMPPEQMGNPMEPQGPPSEQGPMGGPEMPLGPNQLQGNIPEPIGEQNNAIQNPTLTNPNPVAITGPQTGAQARLGLR